ncbi:MAG: hypothetical protein ACHQRM_03720 [Bacteroidia bacterium]
MVIKSCLRNFALLLLPMLLQQCTGVYVYNTTQTPNLSSKHQQQGSLYVGADHEEAQAAWSPKEHLGIMVNSYLCSPFFSDGHNYNSWGTVQGEAAVGYYRCFKKDTLIHCPLFFDVYGGGGLGQRMYDGILGSNGFSGSYSGYNLFLTNEKAFLQSSVFYNKKRLELAFTYQFATYFINAFNLSQTSLDSRMLPTPYLISSFHNDYFTNLNIAFTVKEHWNHITFIEQMAFNKALNYPQAWTVDPNTGTYPLPWDSRFIAINLGIQFSL